LLAGVTGAVEHLAGLVEQPVGTSRRERILASIAAAHAYEHAMLKRLLDGLGEVGSVQICPAPADRCPTVAFRFGDQHPAETARLLGERDICVFDGDYYAFEYFDYT